MNSKNNQASLNNKENLPASLPIGSIRNPTSHCHPQTGEVANKQKKPVTNKKTTNTSQEDKTANGVFKVPLPPKKLLYRKYVLEGKGRENTEKALDLSRNRKAAPTRQTSPLQAMKTPKASPQKNKKPTDVTTTKIGNLPAPQQKRDIGAQTSTAHAQRPIVTVSPTHHSRKRAPAAQTSAPSLNQSRDNVHEQQQKKLKANESYSEYMQLIKAHFDAFTVEENGIEFVIIGVNGTVVWKKFLMELTWYNTGAAMTRKLLCHLFDHKTLATHTLTGKPSPWFKAEVRQLNPLVVQDIIECVVLLKGMTARDVKKVIKNKCAHVAKTFLHSLTANVTSMSETTITVSSERNVINVPKDTSSDSYERNVIKQSEAQPLDLTERNVITESEAASSDSCERNVVGEPENVEVSSDTDSSEVLVV